MNSVYYKVVHKSLHGLNSVTLSRSQACVLYRVGQWVKPNRGCGPLCVFQRLEDARKFWCSDLWRKIFECEIKESFDAGVWSTQHSWTSYLELTAGTVLAREVMLIREAE